MSAITQLREAWESYIKTATLIDGHTKDCAMRIKGEYVLCTCGLSAVEAAIEDLLDDRVEAVP